MVGFPRCPPPGPLAPPPDGRGGAAWWFRSRGASRCPGGAYSSLASPRPLVAGPSRRP